MEFVVLWKHGSESRKLELRAANKEDMMSWVETIGQLSSNNVQRSEKLIDWWNDLFGNVFSSYLFLS